jgi:hypothetical protein
MELHGNTIFANIICLRVIVHDVFSHEFSFFFLIMFIDMHIM